MVILASVFSLTSFFNMLTLTRMKQSSNTLYLVILDMENFSMSVHILTERLRSYQGDFNLESSRRKPFKVYKIQPPQPGHVLI